MNLLAQSGYSTTPQSPFGAIGKAALMTQQQQQQQGMSALQKEFIESQIGLNKAKTTGELSGVGAVDGRIGKLSPTMYTPKSVQKFNESVAAGSPDYSLLEFRPELRLYTRPDGSVGIADTGSGAGEPGSAVISEDVVTPEEAITGAGNRRRTEAEAQNDPERQRKTPVTVIKSKQIRNDVNRLIMAIKAGELKTGPLQGIASQFTSLGETLGSLSGRQVIDMISDATFGQLSEGERKFLADITFSGRRTEEFNIQELEKFKDIMDTIIEIESRDAERLGVGNQSVDDIAAKYE
jgi:hypothetical protein